MIHTLAEDAVTPAGVRLRVVAVPDRERSKIDLVAYADGRPVDSRSIQVAITDKQIRAELDTWIRELETGVRPW